LKSGVEALRDEPFAEPWEARAFALTQVVLGSAGLDRDEFRTRLVAAIAASPSRPYWEAWVEALERLLVDSGVITPEEVQG